MVQDHLRRRPWRLVHTGVYALTFAPLTREQRWMAATLTTSTSVLSHASAGALHGVRPWEGSFETITRPGSGGRKRVGTLLVSRSMTLTSNITCCRGLRVTTAARTVIDLAATLDSRATGRLFRETIRLKLASAQELSRVLERHPHARGTHLLRDLATRYGAIPYARTRSNAEAHALEILHDAGVERPEVNARVAGEEADLTWRRRRLIIEIDGPQYHRFADEDNRKQRAWEAAGYTVRRIPSDAIYDDPGRLIRFASEPV